MRLPGTPREELEYQAEVCFAEAAIALWKARGLPERRVTNVLETEDRARLVREAVALAHRWHRTGRSYARLARRGAFQISRPIL